LILLAAALLVARAAVGQDSAATELEVRVNLAASQLDLIEGNQLLRRYQVAIGQAEFPTPIGQFWITAAEWNPWWVPPAREWTKGQIPIPPGPGNPMGKVKLFFRTFYFIHGTSDSGSIGRPASHGCLRLANPDAVELAQALIRAAVPSIEPLRLEALVAEPVATLTIPFERRVPLSIEYQVLEPTPDGVWVHPNPYRRPLEEILANFGRLLELSGTGLEELDLDPIRRALAAKRTESVWVDREALRRQ